MAIKRGCFSYGNSPDLLQLKYERSKQFCHLALEVEGLKAEDRRKLVGSFLAKHWQKGKVYWYGKEDHPSSEEGISEPFSSCKVSVSGDIYCKH